jgi:hypothetical protein
LIAVLVTPSYAQPSAQAGAGAHPTGTTLTPLWDTSAGYQLLHLPDQTFPFGLNVDGARNFGPWAIAAELGWAYDKSDDVSYHVFNGGAGPRWTHRSTAKIWPFAQPGGFVHTRASTGATAIHKPNSCCSRCGRGCGRQRRVGIVGQVDIAGCYSIRRRTASLAKTSFAYSSASDSFSTDRSAHNPSRDRDASIP